MSINLYAFTYPSAITKFEDYILIKFGDSTRDVDIRMGEQGGSAEYEKQIRIARWNDCKKIKRDYDVHKILTTRGLHHTEGKGTEWFKIPAKSVDEALEYVDAIIEELEGKKVRKKINLRKLQQRTLEQAMEIIDNGADAATVIANLCPRFGKTIWALMLFNAITEKYGNRVMLLPAYWLSVHSSFIDELNEANDFLDIVHVDADNDDYAAEKFQDALDNDCRAMITMSLHGNIEEWKEKYEWVSNIDNDDIFMFADEGDFGTHTDNQVKKLEFILS